MTVYRFAGLRFDATMGRLSRPDQTDARSLRPQVSKLLVAFLDQPRTLLTREQLCASIWESSTVVDFESGLAAVLRELRAELRALGAADDLIETVPRRGYRVLAEVETGESERRFSPAGRKRLFGLLAALLLLSLLIILNRPGEEASKAPVEREPSLAVLPFQQFGEPAGAARRWDLLLADQLLSELWEQRLDQVALIGRASLAPYKSTEDLAVLVAQDLGIDLLIEGSVIFEQDQFTVLARMLAMPEGKVLWSHQLEHKGAQPPSAAVLAQVLADSLAAAWRARIVDQVEAD